MSPDVVVVGAGGDGPALAWRLGDLGHEVTVLEAGPWHGNQQFPNPHASRGAASSSDPADLDGELMDEQFDKLELDTNNSKVGKIRFGPADRTRDDWHVETGGEMSVLQMAGVGGTTQHYYANHPRADVPSIDDSEHWPISYSDLVEYYEIIEDRFAHHPGVVTEKEKVFFEGARQSGYELTQDLNITADHYGTYRPTPNLYARPDPKLQDENYSGSMEYPTVQGDVLANDAYRGGPSPTGAPVSEKARKSSNVTWVPDALETGDVTIRPNAFVTNVQTSGGEATGVEFRDTWNGTTETMEADAVVLAAGSIQTPRLWLNSGLPANDWVGKGMTHHWFDAVHGVFPESALQDIVGQPTLEPMKGQPWVGRTEEQEGILGMVGGAAPGSHGTLVGTSSEGLAMYQDTSGEPWDTHGALIGQQHKEMMSQYQRTMTILISIDDEPQQQNGVSLAEETDENGQLARLDWQPGQSDVQKREALARKAATILRSAGANWVHRSNMSPFLIHIHGTMPLGKVTDAGGEAQDVGRLFVADHSVLPNALGGQNPTHTGQALALRTADQIHDRYLGSDTGGTNTSGSSGTWWGSDSGGSSGGSSGGLWGSGSSGSSDSSGSDSGDSTWWS